MIWAGIHFRTADARGAILGEKVAHYLHRHYFQPVRCLTNHGANDVDVGRKP
jgi:hypothetical protein